MLEEAAVLGRDDGFAQRRRDGVERRPRQAAAVHVDAHLVQDRAVPVEQADVGGPIGLPNLAEGGKGRRRAGAGEQRGGGDRQRGESAGAQCDAPARPSHGSTSSGALGSSPYISGAYSASTRVAGRWNSPAWLRRMTYSTEKRPLGTKE